MSTRTRDNRVHELLATPAEQYNLATLQSSLQVAVELELSTLPPYLCGFWSCQTQSDTAPQLILSVCWQEMLHMGLAANMLTTIGGAPVINTRVPTYPGPLPGGVMSDLTVYLGGLTKEYVAGVYMQIEYPESGPLTPPPPPEEETIGQFYDMIATMFQQVNPQFTGQNQLQTTIGPRGAPHPNVLFPIESLDDALKAISEIKEQGEGTSSSPDAVGFGDVIAHYYRFGEIYNGAKLVPAGGTWTYTGDPVPFPQTYPMAQVPQGGWPDPPSNVSALLQQFDATFKAVLDNLESTWQTGSQSDLGAAIDAMEQLGQPAVQLMQIPLPGGGGNYGPDFIYPT